jgi:hypothetical protein
VWDQPERRAHEERGGGDAKHFPKKKNNHALTLSARILFPDPNRRYPLFLSAIHTAAVFDSHRCSLPRRHHLAVHLAGSPYRLHLAGSPISYPSRPHLNRVSRPKPRRPPPGLHPRSRRRRGWPRSDYCSPEFGPACFVRLCREVLSNSRTESHWLAGSRFLSPLREKK